MKKKINKNHGTRRLADKANNRKEVEEKKEHSPPPLRRQNLAVLTVASDCECVCVSVRRARARVARKHDRRRRKPRAHVVPRQPPPFPRFQPPTVPHPVRVSVSRPATRFANDRPPIRVFRLFYPLPPGPGRLVWHARTRECCDVSAVVVVIRLRVGEGP